MQKISKKDQDPLLNEHEHEGLRKIWSKKSQHFALNTGVWMDGRRYTVNQIIGKVVVLIAEDGSARRVDNPYFLR